MKIVPKSIFKTKAPPVKAEAAPIPLPSPTLVKNGMGILQSLKKDISIKLMVHKALAGYEPPRSPHVLHASDLMRPEGEFCPREKAFLMMGVAKKRDEFVGTAMQITYQHGRDLENHLRNTWLRDHAVGIWKCGVCKTKTGFGKAPKISCPKCGYSHQWNYEEVRFESPVSGISCGIDLLIDVGEPKLRIVEIKTMTLDMFKSLKQPLAEHKFRTSLYGVVIEESKLPYAHRINTKEPHIIYVAKSFGIKDEDMKAAGIADSAFSPMKEFVLERDDGIVATQVNKAIALKAWRDDPKVGLPCAICVNGLTKRAQKCAAVTACWSGAYPNMVTWLEDGQPRHPGKKLV